MQLSRIVDRAFVLHQEPQQIVERFPVVGKLPRKDTPLPVDIHRANFSYEVPELMQLERITR